MILTENQYPGKSYSRIISLVPSLTELLYDLGLESEVVGITKFCIHPQTWFRSKTRVGGTKNIDLEKIHQLKPDLIIANKEENVRDQIEELGNDYDVWLTDVNNIDEAIQMITDIGQITQRQYKAEPLSKAISKGFNELKENLYSLPRMRTAYFIWQHPYMVAAGNTFINDMMPYCGLINVLGDRSRYPEIQLDDLLSLDCNLVILSSEPYPFREKHKILFEQKLPGMKIILANGEMFSWYGSRLLKAVAYFRELNMKLNS